MIGNKLMRCAIGVEELNQLLYFSNRVVSYSANLKKLGLVNNIL